ncbi:MAG: hypothetical protein AAGD01_02535 [Acidobacteriota bacterium]
MTTFLHCLAAFSRLPRGLFDFSVARQPGLSFILGLGLAVGLMAAPAFASSPQLVLDIDPRIFAPDSSPSHFVEVGAQTFFLATQGARSGAEAAGPGRELWVTDGTEEGTRLVVDLAATSKILGPQSLTRVNSERVFFTSGIEALGVEPWASDGTAEGTVLLGDFCPGRCSSDIDGILPFGSRVLFFTADRQGGADTARQWVTDGTVQGTEPFLLGGSSTALVVEGGGSRSRQFLIATRSSHGVPSGWLQELWLSDGTAEGSFSLAAAFPDLGAEGQGRIYGLQLWGNAAFFVVETDDGQRTLWSSDGTVAGTGALKDLPRLPVDAGPVVSRDVPWSFMVSGPVFLLLTEPAPDQFECELWATDGTSAGTSRLVALGQAAGLAPGDLSYFGCSSDLVWVPGPPITPPSPDYVFFPFSDFSTFSQLWATDGTTAGTGPLHDFGPSGIIDFGSSFTTWQGQLFFYDNDDEGAGLFTTTGRSSRVTKVVPLGFGGEANLPGDAIGKVGFPLIFQGWDESGRQPWTSLGTADSSERLSVLDFGTVSSFPRRLLPAPDAEDDEIVFLAYHPGPFGDGQNPEGASRNGLWVSDGSAAGTRLLVDGGVEFFDGVIEAPVLTSAGLFLRRADSTKDDSLLFSSDLQSFQTAAELPTIEDPVAFGDLACFAAHDPDLGVEPWCSDGSPQGTVSLGDLAPGLADPPFGGSDAQLPLSSRPDAFVVAGDRLYFRTAPYLEDGDQLVPSALWRSDGTAAGTRRVWSSAGAGQQGPILPIRSVLDGEPLMVYGEDVYFLAEDLQPALWRLRGGITPELVAPLGTPGAQIQTLVSAEFRGRLVFLLEEDFGGSLWSMDDGPALAGEGARLLATFERIYSSRGGLEPQLVAVGNDLYFSADSGDGAGLELWSTDGTVHGTRRVTDLAPGAADALPQHLGAVGSRLVFSATDGPHGFELWVTDGSADGTALVADLEPGPAGSEPREPLLRGDHLYFSAWTSDAGRELRRVDLSDLISRSCTADHQRFCLRDGRFELLVDWVDPRSLQAGRGTGTPYVAPSGPGGDSADTALAWFFRDTNRELAVKILDGRSINDHHWLFYGALTDVAYWLSAVDLETGEARTWVNPAREICGDGDDRAFPQAADRLADLTLAGRIPAERGRAADAEASVAKLQEPASSDGANSDGASSDGASFGGPCDDPEELCLQDGRFRLRVDWRDQRRPGRQGVGTAIPDPHPDNQQSGAFWFFREGNLELLVKVLDARSVDGHFWVFYGNLTDVEYDLHVTDEVTGRTKTYTNPGGSLCGDADTTFFRAPS